jgi:aflatoxin B1 aldehyde reductase
MKFPLTKTLQTMAATTGSSFRIILGTMTFAGQTNKAVATEMIQSFIANNKLETRSVVELDTARMYEHGATEKLLGEIVTENNLQDKVIIASKMNPFITHEKTLTPESCERQCTDSLNDLQTNCVEIMYLHAPDPANPIEPTLEKVQELYAAGKFKELGLSNYSAWEVAYIHGYMKSKGYVIPTVYQAMYNALTRDIEAELIPCLRKLKMRCYVYNPLAGGILTGKHNFKAGASEGRFHNNQKYCDRFWKESFFNALDMVSAECKVHDIALTSAALRWVRHHSLLSGEFNDGLIIGASSMNHFEANLACAHEGPLPKSIVDAFDNAWTITKADCPSYFRGQSKV